jgi:MFS family permease
MFIIGLTIFTVASVVSGPAQLLAWVVVSRALQDIGSAILPPSTFAS